MRSTFAALAFVALGLTGVGAVSCTEAVEDGGGSGPGGPSVTNGTGYDPVCNDGRPDEVCNFFGAAPETCACFDCVNSAACTNRCKDDGACGADEDCTCVDCFEELGIGCEPPDPSTSEATTDATTATGMGGGGDGGASGAGGGGTTATTATTATTGTTGAGGAGGGA
jgi:hypothetical protein